jgi:hypothetical protein
MSHHLDSPAARQDVRLDITDLYVFRGAEGTVFVMDVNHSLATEVTGVQAPAGYHPEARYEFKLDTDGDAVEDLVYRFVFGPLDIDRLRWRTRVDRTRRGSVLDRARR